MSETWKQVPSWPLYEVSDRGRVRRGTRALRGSVNNDGYQQYDLRESDRRWNALGHQLVLAAFVGRCPVGRETRHLDGNPQNSVLSNLAYGTRRENAADRARHGTENFGERNGAAKLTESDVMRIRALARTLTQREIATRFHVSQPEVSAVINHKRWSHV